MLRLTERAHRACRQVLRTGDVAVDATVGNGHDTRFLAQTVGPEGRVYGFDVQAAALAQARETLSQISGGRVLLISASHAKLVEKIDDADRGRVKVVMFNLGYLPGGDKQITTRSETTLTALESACKVLTEDGLISVIAYPGHPGGLDETTAVETFLQQKEREGWHLQTHHAVEHSDSAPRLFLLSPHTISPASQ